MKVRHLLPVLAILVGSSCGDAEPSDQARAEGIPAAEPEDAVPSERDLTAVPAEAVLLDPTEADRSELLAVDGLDEASVEALIEGRPYDNMLEVDSVLAQLLNPPGRERIYAAVWKPLDLNRASGEEILLIPGVGQRMEHEFEEYRPYRAMAEFHREIGKYVDDAEVRRLARYVELR